MRVVPGRQSSQTLRVLDILHWAPPPVSICHEISQTDVLTTVNELIRSFEGRCYVVAHVSCVGVVISDTTCVK